MTKTVNTDGYRVDEDSALEFLVHHMVLCHKLFETISTDSVAVVHEAAKLFAKADISPEEAQRSLRWLNDMWRYHEDLKNND